MNKSTIVQSWKTTISGFIAGLPIAISGVLSSFAQGAFNGKGKWEIMAGVGLIVMGCMSKDHDVTGDPPKTVQNPTGETPQK